MLAVNEIDVIVPNFKLRLSGVTATVVRLVPMQSRMISLAATAPNLPKDLLQVPLWSLLVMSRNGPSGFRVWHARRNVEMIAGLALQRVLRKRLKLVFTSASQRHHTRLTRWLIRQMDEVIATSAKSAAYLERAARVIHHGIDNVTFSPAADRAAVRNRLGLAPEGLLIGCFGRIRAQKGTDLFVEAALRLCAQFHDLGAVVVGRALPKDADFLEGLQQRVRESGLEDRIQFCDEVPVWEMPDWYRALDVYVAPQRWEGFGLTPLEAMACGVPVVAADVGAFREMVAEGETGYVVEPDSAESLAQAVANYLDDPQRLQTASSAARSHVERDFNIETEARELVAIYRRLIQE